MSKLACEIFDAVLLYQPLAGMSLKVVFGVVAIALAGIGLVVGVGEGVGDVLLGGTDKASCAWYAADSALLKPAEGALNAAKEELLSIAA